MGNTAHEVSDALRGSILRGKLRPGARLRQDRLAEALGVSKIPVREALQRLAAEGLATFDANRGFAVATLTAAEAEEIYALRLALELPLLERAIPHATIVDLAVAEHALETGAHATPEGNWVFHRALYAPSAWVRGLKLVGDLHVAVAPYLLLYLGEADAAEASEAQHRRLLEHCRSRDVRHALDVLREHLDMAGSRLVAGLAAASSGGHEPVPETS